MQKLNAQACNFDIIGTSVFCEGTSLTATYAMTAANPTPHSWVQNGNVISIIGNSSTVTC